MKKIYFSMLFCTLIQTHSIVAQNKILFNATKAEMCSNADWVIDADSHNIFFSSSTHLPYASGSSTTGQSNPQRVPSPPQSGITSTTTELYWDGAISAWAVDCVKQGYTVETLPYNVPITYGTTNAQDLSNYKVFVVDEPNILFSPSEKTAIINFVANGGGLLMIADHTGSDRNFDTYDSPMIWNDLMTTNSVLTDPFGISFDLIDTNNITSTNFPNLPTNTILHGTFGNVTQVKFYSGTTISLNTNNNNSARGLVYKTGSNTTGNINALVASATFQNGKVVAIGDSSIPDDGTGDPNDTNLFDGYTTDAGGNHRKLLMNAIIWLMTPTLASAENSFDDLPFTIVANPILDKKLHLSFSSEGLQTIKLTLYDMQGRAIETTVLHPTNSATINYQTIAIDNLASGVYLCQLTSDKKTSTQRFIVK